MKKVIFGVLVGAVLIAGLVLVQLGRMHAQTAHDTLIEELQGHANIEVLDQSLDRGWLKSQSELRFRVLPNSPMAQGSPLPHVGFTVNNAIDHGPGPMFGWLSSGLGGTPVVAQVDTVFAFDDETREELFGEVASQVPPLDMRTVVRASGVGESTLSVPARRFQSSSGFDVEWKGLEGSFVFTRDGERVVGQMSAPGLEGRGPGAYFTASDLEWVLDYDTHASGLMIGRTQLTVAEVQFGQASAMPPIFAARNWEFWQDTGAQGNQVQVALGQKVAEVEVMGGFYGPGEFELRARKLDAAALVEIQEARQQLEAGGGSAAVAAQGMALLQKLFVHSPEVEISKLSMVTPAGEVRGAAAVAVDGSQPEMLGNPLTLALAVTAELEADLPAPLFGQLVESYARKQLAAQRMSGQFLVGVDHEDTLAYLRDSTIANLRRSGFVVFDGARYRSKAKWSKGQLTVNGMPVDPMQGLGGMMDTSGGGLSFPAQPDPGLPVDGFPASLP